MASPRRIRHVSALEQGAREEFKQWSLRQRPSATSGDLQT
jgi:hypothetical protein